MTDLRDSDDGLGEVRETIGELLATPVGRRWLLRSGLLGAATAAVAGVAPGSAAAAAGRAVGGFAAGAAAAQERRSFHFVVPPRVSGVGLELRVNGVRVPLAAHTLRSRSGLRSKGRLFRKLDTSKLTHFAEARVPRDRGLVMSVWATAADPADEVLVLQSFHAPSPAIRKVARAAFQLEGSYRSVAGSPQRLGALGLQAQDLASWDEVANLDAVVDTHQTAIALTMMHPDVATIAPIEVTTTKALLGQTSEVTNLGTYIGSMTEPWATNTPQQDANGNPSQITIGSTTTTLSTVGLNTSDPTFVGTAQSALVAGVRGTRNTGSLGTVIDEPLDALQDTQDTSTWHQPTGVVNTPTPYVPPVGLESAVQATVSNTGLLYGTYTTLNGSYSGGQVPLKLFNNYVRWVWVYVQYLKQDGTNLSVAPGAAFPNTPNAQSVGLLPQVFTVLGIPIWDTNTITPTLTFPTGATIARILYAGLGNSAADGGWRQYFPADAYPANQYAPQKEVEFPALVTGLFTLGLTAFAILTDIDMISTWAEVRSLMQSSIPEVGELIADLLSAPAFFTVADSFATTVAAGGATYEDIANNGGSASNIWSILAGLGAIIPKVLFTPGVENKVVVGIAAAIVGSESESKLIQAVPLVGEVLAALTLVGDAATFAEASLESGLSPWLFGNEVSLSYPVSVSVKPDQSLAVPRWPETAVSWRLEATLDGASAVAPLTAAFPAQVGSDPVVVATSAPFGGSTITWSFVVLDADGYQVGTAVAKFANDDESAVPSAVDMAITELPEPVTTGTTFVRRDTTSYSTALGGYTWSTSVTDAGTEATSGVQQVLQVAVSTELAVVAVVWQEGDRFWLRGVPIVENGTTISMGTATKNGWARRPYVLFDSFVGASDTANHKLLEPDDTDSGYQLRELTVDPATGDLSWDESVSVGQFLLPVSGAGLHSSGRVAAIHTDSGRFGQVQPAGTPRPPLVAYTAGPGTEIGLLSSPTAVAVTNPGIVLVLEVAVPGAASPAQLSAFDLKGQPVRYFGADGSGFTLPLPEPPAGATYLDLSVDGTGQIYLLSYTGNGSAVANYAVTVYTAAGTVITTSPGTNAARLVVDFWRSIYAANWTALIDTDTGQPHIGDLGVAEPSISRLDPITPPPTP